MNLDLYLFSFDELGHRHVSYYVNFVIQSHVIGDIMDAIKDE